ncbi:MAG: hypothetical protein PHO12_04405 [Bacteroidales bacterium]|nr:hypothetical protein [Bacteroidales bacterium]MDD4684221.1 hypothetical protein [Bacteroidales bacterium]
MKKAFSYLVVFIVLPIIFISCSKEQVYENSISFPNNTWQRIEDGKDITFEKINIKSVKDDYDFNISFIHKPNINVDQISFILRIISPSGISKETIHTIELKGRDKDKFIGNNLGEIIEIKEVIKQYTTLPEVGEYKVIISNYSDRYEITGLEKITLEVIKSNLDYKIEK